MAQAIEETELRQTPLYDLHLELGARMVSLAGYAVPLHYRAGLAAEHDHARSKAGLFDLSHMAQAHQAGDSREIFARAVIAVHGPEALSVISAHAPEAAGLGLKSSARMEFDGIDCHVACVGETDTDEYELTVPAGAAEAIARALLADDRVEPIGLGARDRLRRVIEQQPCAEEKRFAIADTSLSIVPNPSHHKSKP